MEFLSFAWFVFFTMTINTTALALFLLYAGFQEHEPAPGISGVIYFALSTIGYLILFGAM
jgi:hypothetical protein